MGEGTQAASTAQAEILMLPSAGIRVPVFWHPASGELRGNLLLMPALGMQARYYTPLAEALAAQGLNVALMEQRGHGESPLRASRRNNFGFAEVLSDDIPALLRELRQRTGNQPLYLMGHSLGGHYATISAGLLGSEVDGVILVACGSPWRGAFGGRMRRRLMLLCRLIPVLGATLGYYPGHRLGFGGREAHRLMADWAQLCRTNTYAARGLDEDLEAGIANYGGRVLAIRLADDDYAPQASVAAVTRKFQSAALSEHLIDAHTLGAPADHMRWVRRPRAVVERIIDWLPAAAAEQRP
jgi:predicted alpha/beta hydrolase